MCDDAALADTAHYKFHVTVLICVTLFMSLKYFYLVSFTEPGILPSVQMNTEIPNYDNKKPCSIRDYYVEYESKQQLESYFEHMGIKNPVDKYFNLRKFKFLPMLYDEHLNNGAGYVEPKKKQNKLSYCSTCNHLRPPRSFHCS